MYDPVTMQYTISGRNCISCGVSFSELDPFQLFCSDRCLVEWIELPFKQLSKTASGVMGSKHHDHFKIVNELNAKYSDTCEICGAKLEKPRDNSILASELLGIEMSVDRSFCVCKRCSNAISKKYIKNTLNELGDIAYLNHDIVDNDIDFIEIRKKFISLLSEQNKKIIDRLYKGKRNVIPRYKG